MRAVNQLMGKIKQPKGGNFAAMPYKDLPAFMATLRAGEFSVGRLALQFLILTAARSGEVRGATWGEIDLEAAEWRVPPGRMKAGKLHIVPLVPAAVVYDLLTGDPSRRPGPAEGEAACEAAATEPELGSVGAGTGAAVGKLLGRERAVKGGVGLATAELADGQRLTALAVTNAFGDVIGEDGQVMAGPRADDGSFRSATKMIRSGDLGVAGYFRRDQPPGNTTLVCLMTDAALTKTGCGIVSKMAQAGMARAVDPVHSAADGDVIFTLATGAAAEASPMIAGVIAAAITAEAIRDGVRRATGLGGIPALGELG